ncbi:hypothetical protein GCM10010435_73630 [Winogradskya consettensis]|uniref:Uncharacterized protein n=1 Tax=Winogradskya consettensis TaxID=113560 RepID=A0A919SQT1_9ACTN|nr:hypothetical protein Aco04nite_43950 [Actinoplanes consettensis]
MVWRMRLRCNILRQMRSNAGHYFFADYISTFSRVTVRADLLAEREKQPSWLKRTVGRLAGSTRSGRQRQRQRQAGGQQTGSKQTGGQAGRRASRAGRQAGQAGQAGGSGQVRAARSVK